MQAWQKRMLILIGIVLLPFEIELVVALWPFLPWVGKAFAGLLMTLCICGAVLSVAYVWNVISIWLARRRFVVVGGLVFHREEDGMVRHLSAEHESAKLLPAPVQVTEVKEAEETEAQERARVIRLAELNMHLRDIEKAAGVKYWKVQKYVADWKQSQADR